jgi:hypothetical protein
MLICIKKYTVIGLISLIFLGACGPSADNADRWPAAWICYTSSYH